MNNSEDHYFSDMEPLDNGDEFFIELCDLISKHADTTDEKLRYLCALADFKEEWMETYGATAHLWMEPKQVQKDGTA